MEKSYGVIVMSLETLTRSLRPRVRHYQSCLSSGTWGYYRPAFAAGFRFAATESRKGVWQMACDHEGGLPDHSVPLERGNKVCAKNRSKRKKLSGPELMRTTDDSEN
ncbi:hypothetical protein HYC85_029235 [Camellia sinensis]|uniref:Uncharacterized protein n=1 Tax=Camellia sinensis TaxID=4442 RepID=A0A7J7G1C2_CAMSI|nr:hypothetical protein HYC85_029235 [Camellia sinensis]